MITLIRCAKRASGLDVADFHARAQEASDWSGLTDVLAARQALTLVGGYRRGEPVYDVIDELDFASEAEATAALKAGTWPHELLDPASIALLITEPHVAKDGPVGATYVKNYEVVTKLPEMDRAEFDRYWIEVHGPLAAQIPTIRRYVQAHLAPAFRDGGEAPFDGLAITCWDDVNAMREGTTYPVYELTRADEANFLDGELPFVITTEKVLV